ncbi:MerR family transcriptional regulator [Kitasatospora atroaurantiaca]|uniref:DNA-binding transcriptional MerR regulator n=1 Tax=Kitasatospora atroaurantiaca TaxID=285545 RepID=A0A561ES65_9ACTN|nr:MerR family transcriptional regulator [Kitasatospora atroaurantiaca]TWE18455.1 DNA-binding transcriptional MerR regulator [Kitasatospora atroaurantiaca]
MELSKKGATPVSGYSVGQVAAIAKVTVRTLHHYDEIGLLSPAGRTPAGYRRYGDDDLDRLQQILFYRELGFPLDEIAAILDDESVSPTEHLRRQHQLISARITHLQQLAAAVEHAMEARKMGIQLTPEEKFEVFGEDYQESWEAEAEQRWGGTEAWKESQQRTATYTKADWERIKAEVDALNQRLAAAFGAGLAPDSGEAMDLAEVHRQHMVDSFYDCTYQIHRGIADLYVTDPRFTATYEKVAPGLARWLHDAILANADRAGRAQA